MIHNLIIAFTAPNDDGGLSYEWPEVITMCLMIDYHCHKLWGYYECCKRSSAQTGLTSVVDKSEG